MSVQTDAIEVLDRAVAYIEKHGFNIHTYGHLGLQEGPCCYIGTVSRSCDEYPITDTLGAYFPLPKALLPEVLVEVYTVLDQLADPLVDEEIRKANLRPDRNEPGRVIEAYGFTLSKRTLGDNQTQTAEAVNMLRKAKEVFVKELALDVEVPDNRVLVEA